MKNIVLLFSIYFVFSNVNMVAQSSVHNLDGESYNVSAGIHSGVFDSNHKGSYPLNIGVVLQYDYYPDIRNNLFFGSELGTFFAFSDTDVYGRKTRDVFVDITLYPGISIPLEKRKAKNKNPQKLIKYFKDVRRLNLALGFTVIYPLRKRSEGSGVNIDAIKPAIGFSFRSSYELKNRVSAFLNISRISKDLDGYAVTGTTIHMDNVNKVTYVFKLGILYSFITK